MDLHEELRKARITHQQVAELAGRARVTVTLQLTGRQRLQPVVRDAAIALLHKRPADLVREAASLIERQITEGTP